MPNRATSGDALAGIRSSLAADLASLAGQSPIHSQPAIRYGEPTSAGSRLPGSADVHVTVNLNGGVVFLDDERRMRLLAREIKRLIIEDVRRGIDV